jgi:hypothetical protein
MNEHYFENYAGPGIAYNSEKAQQLSLGWFEVLRSWEVVAAKAGYTEPATYIHSILDVGAGTGQFLQGIVDNTTIQKVQGVEIAEWAQQNAIPTQKDNILWCDWLKTSDGVNKAELVVDFVTLGLEPTDVTTNIRKCSDYAIKGIAHVLPDYTLRYEFDAWHSQYIKFKRNQDEWVGVITEILGSDWYVHAWGNLIVSVKR